MAFISKEEIVAVLPAKVEVIVEEVCLAYMLSVKQFNYKVPLL